MEEAQAPAEEPSLPSRLTLSVLTLLLTGGVYLFAGSVAQVMNVAFGLWFTELFIFLGVGWVLTRMSRRSPVDYARLRWCGPAPIALGAGLGALNYFGMVVPLQALAVRLTPHFLKDMAPSVERLFERQSPLELAVIMGAVCVAAPVAEEFCFRGILQQGFAVSERTTSRGIFWTAVIFSVFHQDPVGFWARVELGILFGVLFARSGSLWPGVAAHAANNLTASLLYFLARGDAAAAADDSSLPVGQTLGLLAGGVAILVAFFQLVRAHPGWLRSKVPERDPYLPGERSFFRLSAPWFAGGCLFLGVVGAADSRGVYLNFFDLTHGELVPPAHERPEEKTRREALEATRKLARSGRLPLSAYTQARGHK